jgi:hypothetical protein
MQTAPRIGPAYVPGTPYCLCGARGWLKCPACAEAERAKMHANLLQRGGCEESEPVPCEVEARNPEPHRLTDPEARAACMRRIKPTSARGGSYAVADAAPMTARTDAEATPATDEFVAVTE